MQDYKTERDVYTKPSPSILLCSNVCTYTRLESSYSILVLPLLAYVKYPTKWSTYSTLEIKMNKYICTCCYYYYYFFIMFRNHTIDSNVHM